MFGKVDANDLAREGPAVLDAALAAIEQAPPTLAAPAPLPPVDDLAGRAVDATPTLRNYHLEEAQAPAQGRRRPPRPKRHVVPITEIGRDLRALTGGWPKRVWNLPFAVDGENVRLLEHPEDLFAWVASRISVSWGHGADAEGISLIPRADFYSHVAGGPDGERYRAVENWPHEPPIPGHFYAWKPPDGYTPTGEYLAGLLNYFDNAERDEDRALIKALFLLPAWGGPYGGRPAFVLEAPDRRCGKTTLSDVVGVVYGGAVDFDLTRAGEEHLVTRLLSAAGLTKRIVRMDNIKKLISSSVMENLITSVEISGKVLFHGEGSRPNSLVWIVTANGPCLSRDVADRCFLVRLKKPDMHPEWRESVLRYATEKRACILADVVDALRRPPVATDATDRCTDFVRQVLARCVDDPKAVARIVALTVERRNAHDDDLEEAETLRDAFDEDLRRDALPDETIFWTAAKMAEVVNRALNENLTTRKVSHFLKAHLEAGRLPRVTKYRTAAQKGWHLKRPPPPEDDNPLPPIGATPEAPAPTPENAP